MCRKGWGKASFHCLILLIFHNPFLLLSPYRQTSENPQARYCEWRFLSPLQAVYWIHINRYPLNSGCLTLSIKVQKCTCLGFVGVFLIYFLGVSPLLEKTKQNPKQKFLELFTWKQPEKIIFNIIPNFCLSALQTPSHDLFLLHLHRSFFFSQLPACFFLYHPTAHLPDMLKG